MCTWVDVIKDFHEDFHGACLLGVLLASSHSGVGCPLAGVIRHLGAVGVHHVRRHPLFSNQIVNQLQNTIFLSFGIFKSRTCEVWQLRSLPRDREVRWQAWPDVCLPSSVWFFSLEAPLSDTRSAQMLNIGQIWGSNSGKKKQSIEEVQCGF